VLGVKKMEEISVKRLNVEILNGPATAIEYQYKKFQYNHPLAKVVDIQTPLIPPLRENEGKEYTAFLWWKDKIQVKGAE